METIERAQLAWDYHRTGYNCAQAVACAFSDVIGLPLEQIAALTGAFGGGFRAGEICGAISGAAIVLGARWPHDDPRDPTPPEASPLAVQLGITKSCDIYIVSAVELLEEMLAEE